MESPNAAEKLEASQIKETETDAVKSEEQQKLESSQTPSEPRNESNINDENLATEHPSQPEKVVQTKESSEGTKTQDPVEVKETAAEGGKQEEPEKQTTRIVSTENASEETSKLTSDASKPAASIGKTEEQKDEASSEDPKEQGSTEQEEKVTSEDSKNRDTVPTTKPEAEIEEEQRRCDNSEANGVGGQGPEEKKDEDTSAKPEGQNDSLSQGNKNVDANDAMEIDAEPVNTGSGQAAPAGSDEHLPTEAKQEQEYVAGSAADSPPKDAMEVDSKTNEEDTTLNHAKTEEQATKQNRNEETPTEPSVYETPSGNQASAPKPGKISGESQQPEPTTGSTSTDGKPTAETTKRTGKAEGVTGPQKEDEKVKEEATLPKDTADQKETTSGRPRRSSARNAYQPRTLRPRTSGRVNNTAAVSEPPTDQDSTSPKPRSAFGPSRTKQSPVPGPMLEKQGPLDDENSPRPVMEAKGLVMRIDEAVFVTEDQLDELKIARLTDKKVKPFEHLTFQDLRTYNRDQLRAYCYAYGMARRKKTEMEADMARYLSYWNKGREGFALHEYVPTSSRVIDRVEPNPSDIIGAFRGATTTQPSPGSREGSVTPTTSNGKPSASAKPSSSRGATPSRSGAPPANSARVSGSQGSSALSSASPAGAPTSTGNSQAPGSTQAGIQRTPGATSRVAKPANMAPILPRGFGTSFKQRVHARQAGAKFKAAYNGAGPAIVNIVENAAAYFEGKDSPEVIVDQAKSYERYQFNVDMLNEIFDGVPDDSDEADGDVEMTGTEGNEDGNDAPTTATGTKGAMGLFKRSALENLASRVASGKRKAQAAELTDLETQFKEMEETTKYTERTNMRLFQRLERAETKDQIESVKQEFEKIHNIKFDESSPPPLVRRKLDKTLPPLIMSDEKCRILRFKVS